MRRLSKNILAFTTICLTGIGIIFSIFLIVQVWRYRMPATEKLQTSVDQFSTVLQISDDGLVVIDQVVQNVYTSTVYLDSASHAFSQTVQGTSQFIDSASTFVGDNLLTTITNTQTALGSAQASAKVIDNILGTLSRVPLIGITYNPSVPLNTALGDVSSSLDPLQNTLKNFQTDLQSTQSNMQEFSGQITTLNTNIVSIQKNLNQAQTTIDKYRTQIHSLQAKLDNARTNLPRWMTIAAWIVTGIIAWLIIIQIAIMLQAISTLTTPLAREAGPGNLE